jgi:hypothetical protein
MTQDTNIVETKDNNILSSKIAAFAREHTLLSYLIPPIDIQILTESTIDEQMPRTEDDSDDLRILVNYKNERGNTIIYPLLNPERYDQIFTIDDFLAGYRDSLDGAEFPDDPVQQVDMILMSGLTMALSSILQISPEDTSESAIILSNQFLKAIMTIVYDDPLDVIIFCQDHPDMKGVVQIDNIWTVKTRPMPTVQESVTEA